MHHHATPRNGTHRSPNPGTSISRTAMARGQPWMLKAAVVRHVFSSDHHFLRATPQPAVGAFVSFIAASPLPSCALRASSKVVDAASFVVRRHLLVVALWGRSGWHLTGTSRHPTLGMQCALRSCGQWIVDGKY